MLAILIILEVFIVIGIIICSIGLTLSLKNKHKIKKLQAASDYCFKTKNGSYSFNYMIKGFVTPDGKNIKIVIQPVLGFSDLRTSSTNRANIATVVITGKSSGKSEEKTFDICSLSPSITMPVSSELSSEELNVDVRTTWNLGGSIIFEELKIDYSK